MIDNDFILITDIGSTNTKGILLHKESNGYKLQGIAKVGTTVEYPFSDVKIGLYRVIRLLEEQQKVTLLNNNSDERSFTIASNVSYLTTSSAGGGLQILVIGLALNESASSAERAAYGAGGVILDTIAVDDRRSPVERIQLIDLLRPDIILFSGGIDGGAYASVIRMGELLKAANPQPKFGVESRVPLIYAGNIKAQDFIKQVFGEKYDLHLIANIRPTMKEENLEPARDEIHRLFMENVMEQAPGYAELKNLISDPIIPTPAGVIKSLETISNHFRKHIIAVDIGGATTDIFSNIFGRYYRTVSANYGMSYSISNVMADSGFDKIRRWLPSDLDDDYIRNYITNKMLYPTYIADNDFQEAIEHVAAREAIRMSKDHHLRMNFQIQRIGFLDAIKSGEKCRFKEAMYQEKTLQKRNFALKDFDIIIGAGGVITGTKQRKQLILLLADAFEINGITEIWRDPEFISPQLGKLSDLAPELAESLLLNNGYEKLALSVKPLFKPSKKPKKLMTIKKLDGDKIYDIFSDSLLFIETEKETEFEFNCLSGCSLGVSENPFKLKCSVPLLIDTRVRDLYDLTAINNSLNLYNFAEGIKDLYESFSRFIEDKQMTEGTSTINRSLPYTGQLYVEEGTEVKAEDLLGETKFDPPMLFILTIMLQCGVDQNSFRKGMLISEGETVGAGQRVFHLPAKSVLGANIEYHSPVSGLVEKINYDSGSVYVREIQDYPLKPIKLKVAEKLGIPPKELRSALKKQKNDFVRTGETIAKCLFRTERQNFSKKGALLFASPTTGTITDIDYREGTVTLQYLKKPFSLYAGVKGKIKKTEENRKVTIEYDGTTINGIIGFGKENYGVLAILSDPAVNDLSPYHDKVLACLKPVDGDFLQKAQKATVKGLIIPSINNSDLVKFLGNEIGVALTGKEPIPFPIIITEGSGNFPMSKTIAKMLAESEGKQVYLDTLTQIRAGVKRPKIIITG